jgi:tRNA threonylcarbamoyladenosine biosynthesis protein TsaB
MTVIGLDTSLPTTAVCVLRDDGRAYHTPPPSADRLLGAAEHSRELLPELDRLMRESGAGWSEVHAIAVGVGPGTFTGLRIGIATARALAQALGKPVVPVGTLASLASGIEARPQAAARARLPVLDARRNQVFAALRGREGGELWAPLVAGPEELAGRITALGGPVVAAGSGAIRFRRELEAAGAEVLPDPDPAHRISARHICALAEEGRPARPEAIQPIYLRPPDAERWLERDTT